MNRVKTFAATGVAPAGRIYAGDLNDIQDAAAALTDLAQNLSVGTVAIGETGLVLSRFGAGEARLSGHMRFDGNVVVGGNMTIAGAIAGGGVVPAGALMQWAGVSAPSGWLLADGALVSRATYASLFAAIGTAYGAGDGSTTFAVPNLKGRVPVGLDAANAKFDVRGETGGAETVALTIAELAVHNHALNDPSHNHSINNPAHDHGTNGVASGGANPNAPGGVGVMGSNEEYLNVPVNLDILAASAGVSANAAVTGIGVFNTGSGSAHQNLPPYITLNYIIKT